MRASLFGRGRPLFVEDSTLTYAWTSRPYTLFTTPLPVVSRHTAIHCSPICRLQRKPKPWPIAAPGGNICGCFRSESFHLPGSSSESGASDGDVKIFPIWCWPLFTLSWDQLRTPNSSGQGPYSWERSHLHPPDPLLAMSGVSNSAWFAAKGSQSFLSPQQGSRHAESFGNRRRSVHGEDIRLA